MESTGERLKERLTRLFEDGAAIAPVVVYLFGSHAAGRPHRESDVDVGVLLPWGSYPSARDRFAARVELTSWLEAELRRGPLDVVVLNDAPPHLGRHIVTTGIRVFCSDPEVAHAYLRDVMLRAADLEPFLRRARRTKLEALAR
jgi:predicted nucleotidyltransferase